MKSVLIFLFTLCSAIVIQRREVDDNILNSDPFNDEDTDADIAAYLMQAVAQDEELNSNLKELNLAAGKL